MTIRAIMSMTSRLQDPFGLLQQPHGAAKAELASNGPCGSRLGAVLGANSFGQVTEVPPHEAIGCAVEARQVVGYVVRLGRQEAGGYEPTASRQGRGPGTVS